MLVCHGGCCEAVVGGGNVDVMDGSSEWTALAVGWFRFLGLRPCFVCIWEE